MEKIQNAVVTSIDCVMNVHSCKGRKFRMDGRTSFGLTLCISGQITYHMNGKDGIITRKILPLFGSYIMFCNVEYDDVADPEQLHVRSMVDAYRALGEL